MRPSDVPLGGAALGRAPEGARRCGPAGRRRPSVRGGGPSVRGGGPSVRGGGPSVRGGGPSVRGGGPSVRGGGPSVRGGGPSRGGSNSRTAETALVKSGGSVRCGVGRSRGGSVAGWDSGSRTPHYPRALVVGCFACAIRSQDAPVPRGRAAGVFYPRYFYEPSGALLLPVPRLGDCSRNLWGPKLTSRPGAVASSMRRRGNTSRAPSPAPGVRGSPRCGERWRSCVGRWRSGGVVETR